MKQAIFTNAVMTGNLTSAIINLEDANAVGIQLFWPATGAPTGTFEVDVSCDSPQTPSPKWTKLTAASAYVVHGTAAPARAAGDQFIDFTRDSRYEMMRVRFVFGSGGSVSSLLNATASVKFYRPV